ncbi:MAG: type II toxin-antitoxin system RelB/DinJ family antitoxin [Phascolarctobacterium sp.]
MAKSGKRMTKRREPDVKKQAEEILLTLRIPVSNAINMFYKQIILQRGLPFDVKIPYRHPLDMSKMTEAELDEALEKGYQDVLAGRVKPASEVFASLAKEFGL